MPDSLDRVRIIPLNAVRIDEIASNEFENSLLVTPINVRKREARVMHGLLAT